DRPPHVRRARRRLSRQVGRRESREHAARLQRDARANRGHARRRRRAGADHDEEEDRHQDDDAEEDAGKTRGQACGARQARGQAGRDQEEARDDRPYGHGRSVPPLMMPRWLALVFLCFTVFAAPRAAYADDPAMRAAKRHYDRGEKLFALGKFDEALDEYEKAFDAKPIPDFLFNIGQCYRNLGDFDQAIFSYKKYLSLEPDAPNKVAVEALIADLEN